MTPAVAPLSRGTSLALVLWAMIAIAIAWRQPAPSRAAEGAADFSVSNAMEHVQWIAREPHPVGTAAHADVARRLERELRQLGLEVETQDGRHVDRRGANRIRIVQVHNVLAKRPGTASTGSVVLMAHYDSAIGAPGAADDGAGVAVLLETARLLASAPAPRNDVIFVITDAEETGLNGARVFLAEHPWARDIGAILNFEARGVSGPSMLFDTGEHDGWLIRQFASEVPAPFGSSLAPALYEHMPNSTDLSVFRGSGVSRLNFAFAEGWQAYHTARDEVTAIDVDSLRHHGTSAVALARQLGSLDLKHAKGGSSRLVFFNLGPVMIRYDEWFALPIAVLAFAGVCAFVVRARRANALRWRDVLIGFICVPLAVIVTFGVTRAVWWLVLMFSGDRRALWQQAAVYMPAFVMLAAIVVFVLHRVLRRFISSDGVAAAAMTWFAIAAAATALLLPGASHVFAWPLLAGTLAAWACRAADEDGVAMWHIPAIAAGSLIVLLIVAPALRVSYLAMPTQAVLFVPLFALAFFLLSPYADLVAPRLSRAVSILLIGVLAAAGVMLAVAIMRANRTGGAIPSGTPIYVTARASAPAVWAWYDGQQPRGPGQTFEIPEPELPGPEMSVDGDVVQGDTRTLSLRLVSRRAAPEAGACIRSTQGILRASSGGRSFEFAQAQTPAARPRQLLAAASVASSGERCDMVIATLGATPEGVPISVDVPADAAVDVEVVDRTYDLTSSPELARVLKPQLSNRPVTSVNVMRVVTIVSGGSGSGSTTSHD